MDEFLFYIDDVAVEQPEGWQDFEEEVVRDQEKRYVYFSFPLNLTFINDTYTILDDKWQDDYNSVFKFSVIDNRGINPELIVNAIIKMSTCEFNLTKHTVQCNIDDATYQAQVFSNLNQKVLGSATKSKNGADITPCTNLGLTIFNPTDGSDFPEPRLAYDVLDVLRHLVSYVSDGTVSVESDWYDNLPVDERLCMCTGAAMRDGDVEFEPEVDINELFEELWKKFNLYLIIENPLINSVIRLEDETYLFDNDDAIVLSDIKDLIRTMDYDILYNRVKLGSEKFERSFGNEWLLPYFQFFGFSTETYDISGVIGVDKELDLSSRWVIDTNAFELTLTTSDDSYKDDIFLIQYDNTTNSATKCHYYPLDGTAALYNEVLLNSNVADRFSLYGDFVLNSGLLESNFQAFRSNSEEITKILVNTTASTFIDYEAYPYNDDSTPPNFDDGGNYDTTTFTYTAPSNGVFRFESSFIASALVISQILGSDFKAFAWIVDMGLNINGVDYERFDEVDLSIVNGLGGFGNLTINGNQLATLGYNGEVTERTDGYIGFTGQRSLILEEGDTVTANVKHNVQFIQTGASNPSLWNYKMKFYGQTFKTVVTPGTGGDYRPADPDKVQIGIYENQSIPVTSEKWGEVRANPTLRVQVDTGNNDPRITYIKRMSRNLVTGESKVELTFNRLQSFI